MSKRLTQKHAVCPGCGDTEALTAVSLCWRCDVVLYQMAREQKRSRLSLYREITHKGGLEALSILNWKTDAPDDDLRLAEQELQAMQAERAKARREAMGGNKNALLITPKVEHVETARETPKEEALRLARMNPRRIIPIRKGEGLLAKVTYFEPYLDAVGRVQVRELRGV